MLNVCTSYNQALHVAKLFAGGGLPYTPFFAHARGYAALAAESPDQCMAVAYEDLKVRARNLCFTF